MTCVNFNKTQVRGVLVKGSVLRPSSNSHGHYKVGIGAEFFLMSIIRTAW